MAEQATKQAAPAPTLAGHGAMRLPAVDLDSDNLELKDDD